VRILHVVGARPNFPKLAPAEDPSAHADAISRQARRQFDGAAIRRYFESAYAAAAEVPRLERMYEDVLAAR
jgi:hypothetical protein